MIDDIFIGIDSSCYTTSLAVCDSSGRIAHDLRKLLPVKDNTLGLRQSEAVFLHIKNYREFFNGFDIYKAGNVKGICVSSAPRSIEGSYMPVFCVGEMVADAVSSATSARIHKTSHQQGHLYSSLIGNDLRSDCFLAVHLSGGTSEILRVSSDKSRFETEIKGSTQDISAGQLLDRIGVRLGYCFPAGPSVEKTAMSCPESSSCTFKTYVHEGSFSFSGVEAQAFRALEAGYDASSVCRGAEISIASTLAKSIEYICREEKIKDVIFFGGVICDDYLRNKTKELLGASGITAYYAGKEFASDNACGLAKHAFELYSV